MSNLNYTSYVAELSGLMTATSTESWWSDFLTGCIDYSEQRIYREIDLVATTLTDGSASTTANTRVLTVPSTLGFRVMEAVNVMTPSSAVYPAGTRNPVQFVSKAFIDSVYPNQSSATGVPKFAYRLSEDELVFGPSPDQTYAVEITGTYRPTPLSSVNSSTFLTQLIPDLFMAASMVYASGFQRDFGGQSDSPQQAQSWENQYQLLKQSADVEELRKQYMSQGWGPQQPNQVATPPRA